MLEKLTLALKSRTVWTGVLLFVNAGVAAVHPLLSPSASLLVDGGLAMLLTYFHVNPSQNYTSGV